MKKTLFVMLLLIGAMAMFVGFEQLADASEQKQLSGLEITNKISEEWKMSGKQFLAGQGYSSRGGTGCTRCHDGMVFADQPDNADVPSLRLSDYNLEVAEEAAAYAAALEKRPHVIGITCQACHSGFGKELMNAGGYESERMGYIDGVGQGATCMYCHDIRYGTPDSKIAAFEAGERIRTPHYSAAAELVTGLGGLKYDDVKYPSGTHANLEDSCVTCHMPKANEGYATHEFGVKGKGLSDANLQAACGSCHIGVDRQYVDDFKAEIKELAYQVRDAVEAGLPEGVTIDDIFGNDGAPEGVTKEQVIAAYNYKLVAGGRSDTVKYDGSYGVHNPPYAKALLNESLKKLTAE